MSLLSRACFVFVVLAVSLGDHRSACADFVRLALDSEPGEYVGQGQDFLLEYDNDLGSRLQPFTSQTSIRVVLSDAVGTTFNTFAQIHFRTDTVGVPLQVGTYLGARRAAFAAPGEPGMDVLFQNRGSNQLFGEFTINDVDFFELNGLATLGRIDINFEQHSETPTNPALFGNFFYQHSGFVVVPEPATVPMFLVTATVVAIRRRR